MQFMSSKERKRFFREAGNDKYKALHTRPLRVKVYARVSTEHESQINALIAQKEWYSNQICDNWIFNPDTDMYVDEGVTGTSVKERDGFLQMIEDAKKDPEAFDIIITREVCRFARNVEEAFRYTRELKELGIGILFISDNIWSFDDSTDGIIKLSIMASLAQSESKKVSERALAGQEISRQNGQPYGNGNILGYDKVPYKKNVDINPKTGEVYKTTFTYIIDEVQAITVRRIYQLCINGLGSKRIKRILMEEGYRTAKGGVVWQESTINRILNNPTYMGYNAYGKSKVVDYLSHEVEYEHDIAKLDLVKGDWEPIISEEDWWLAYSERAKRKVVIQQSNGSTSKYGAISAENMWIRKLQCQCGTGLRRNIWRKNKLSNEEIYGYSCYNQVNNGSKAHLMKLGLPYEDACDVQNVQECKLEMMSKRIFEILLTEKQEAMQLAMEMIVDCYTDEAVDNTKQIAALKRKVEAEEQSKVNSAMMMAKGLIGEDILKRMLLEIEEKIKGYQDTIKALEAAQVVTINKQAVISNLRTFFSQVLDFTQPVIEPDLVDRYLKKVICRSNSEFVWVFNFSKFNNQEVIERINHLSEEYKQTLVVDTNFNIFLEFDIPFEESVAYMKTRGRRIVKRGWDTIKVKVALDLN